MSTNASLEENKRVVEEFIHRLGRGEVREAFELFTEDGRWSSPRGGPGFTRDEEADNIIWLYSKMEEGKIRFDIGVVTAEDDHVALQMESYGKMVNGTVYNNVYHMLFEMAGGKIKRCFEYADTAHTMKTLSTLPDFPPPAARSSISS
jgi:ketosteroid isomerase-like protein